MMYTVHKSYICLLNFNHLLLAITLNDNVAIMGCSHRAHALKQQCTDTVVIHMSGFQAVIYGQYAALSPSRSQTHGMELGPVIFSTASPIACTNSRFTSR